MSLSDAVKLCFPRLPASCYVCRMTPTTQLTSRVLPAFQGTLLSSTELELVARLTDGTPSPSRSSSNAVRPDAPQPHFARHPGSSLAVGARTCAML